MILKIGTENGYKYIQTQGNVEIKKYDINKIITEILEQKELEDKNFQEAKRIHKEKGEEYPKFKPELTGEKVIEIAHFNLYLLNSKGEFNPTLGVKEDIIHYLTEDNNVKCIGIDEMLKILTEESKDNNGEIEGNILSITYYDDEKNITLLIHNYYGCYLLNDEGKTIDIIK